MRERTSVTTDTSGRRVMAKVAGTAEEARQLEREARQLEAARHPGVAELVGVDGHGIGAILLTAHVDGPTLASVGRLPLEESAGLLAALATTLADLHDLGVVHGAVAPEHVIVGPGGRPVLCSLGHGGTVHEDGLSPSVDVAALGDLARFLAPDPPAGHVLSRIGDEASARDVAELLQREVPAARLPRGLPSPPPVVRPLAAAADPLAAWRRERGSFGPRRRPARSLTLAAAGVVGAVVVGGGAFLVAGSPAATTPAPAEAPVEELAGALPPDDVQPGPPTTRAGLASSTTTTTTAAVRRNCPPAAAVLQADVDGDGCPEALRYADGILQAGDVRWALGRSGDQVATGDWGCQGARTLALFRPSTGEVFRFDGWAGPGTDLTATAVGRVPGGQALRAADVDRDGCHEAVVERGTGPAEVLRLARAQP